MPGEVAWSLEKGPQGTLEFLLPDEATSFQIYDPEHDTYRVLVIYCDPEDMKTKLFEFDKTPDIDMDGALSELEQYCDDDTLLREMFNANDDLIETYVKPEVPFYIFVGHYAVFSDS